MDADRLDSKNTGRRPAEAARMLVLDQHRRLRWLLTMGLAQARALAGQSGAAHQPLRSLVSLIRDLFVQHLSDEEALIVPILDDDLPVGPQRVAALRQEHDRQRAELDTLCAWPEEASDQELEVRFEGLTRVLLADIAHEERELIVPEVIRDVQVVVDQSDG